MDLFSLVEVISPAVEASRRSREFKPGVFAVEWKRKRNREWAGLEPATDRFATRMPTCSCYCCGAEPAVQCTQLHLDPPLIQ